MSSLRPLLTILLLAAVGVVLYMKINETEPVVPAGVGEWTAGALEIGGESTTGGATAPGSAIVTAPPNYSADAAPAFKPGAATPGGGASTLAAGGDAPSWSPGPTANSDPPKAEGATPNTSPATAESSPVARTAEPQLELPAIPELPAKNAGEQSPNLTDTANAGDAPASTPTPAPKSADAASTAETTAPTTSDAPDTPADVPSPAEDAAQMAAADPATDAISSDPIAPLEGSAEAPATPVAPLFPAVRVAVQAELERGELAQALLRLSDWYGDPSLSPAERQEVDSLLSQLAGSVIWEGPPAHRLEPAHVVQSGETLQEIGEKYDLPWQLLGKINGVADPNALQPGQQLKVIRGKFSAIVDISERTMTLFLDRRYAGKFAVEVDPTTAIEEGQWKVDQKLLTPAGGGVYGGASGATEDRSLLLANTTDPAAQASVLRGPGSSDPASPQPDGRVLRLKSTDVNDVYDILSVGSKVTIRR